MHDHTRLGDPGKNESSAAHHVVFPDRPGELLLVLDPVLQRHHRRAVTHQRPQPGRGGVGIEGLDTKQHEVARADVSGVIGGGRLHLEVTFDAAHAQPVLAKCPQVGAPRDEVHLRSGLGDGPRNSHRRRPPHRQQYAFFATPLPPRPLRPFDLDHDPLARFVLIRHGAEHYTLCIVVHHLVTDLWSMNVLCNELSSLYDACVTGVEPSLPAQVGTFADYAREERSSRGAEARDRAVAYWRSVLAKGVSEASLPFEPPPVIDSEGDVERTSLTADQVARLRALADRFRCTPFVVLLTAYFVFLHRLTGQERVSIGSFFANRADPRFVNVCGLLFNDLPITVECAPTATFDEVLVQVRDEFLDLLPHATTPFDRSLVAEASRGTSKVLYEQHNVTCQLYESTPNRLRLEGCDVQQRRFFYGSKYDLMVYGSLSDDRLDLWFNYRVDRFDQKLVRAWLDAFGCLLVGLMEDPHSLIANVVLEPSGLDRARAARDEVPTGRQGTPREPWLTSSAVSPPTVNRSP